jgi:hypothetical protein
MPIDDQKKIIHKMRLSDIIRSITATGKLLMQQKRIVKDSEAVCAKLSTQVVEFQNSIKPRSEVTLEQTLAKEKAKLDEGELYFCEILNFLTCFLRVV